MHDLFSERTHMITRHLIKERNALQKILLQNSNYGVPNWLYENSNNVTNLPHYSVAFLVCRSGAARV
jgi:hypothetical protein